MNKYRINVLFTGGTTYCTTVPEKEKDKIIKCLNDKEIEQIIFGPDLENDETYIVNIKNINILKISKIKEM